MQPCGRRRCPDTDIAGGGEDVVITGYGARTKTVRHRVQLGTGCQFRAADDRYPEKIGVVKQQSHRGYRSYDYIEQTSIDCYRVVRSHVQGIRCQSVNGVVYTQLYIHCAGDRLAVGIRQDPPGK